MFGASEQKNNVQRWMRQTGVYILYVQYMYPDIISCLALGPRDDWVHVGVPQKKLSLQFFATDRDPMQVPSRRADARTCHFSP